LEGSHPRLSTLCIAAVGGVTVAYGLVALAVTQLLPDSGFHHADSHATNGYVMAWHRPLGDPDPFDGRCVWKLFPDPELTAAFAPEVEAPGTLALRFSLDSPHIPDNIWLYFHSGLVADRTHAKATARPEPTGEGWTVDVPLQHLVHEGSALGNVPEGPYPIARHHDFNNRAQLTLALDAPPPQTVKEWLARLILPRQRGVSCAFVSVGSSVIEVVELDG